eukprot:3046141-Pyramimonas_sp.AAC.1
MYGAQAMIVECLLKRRVAMCRSTDGSTALIWAAKCGRMECCRYLIEAGCAPPGSNILGLDIQSK